MYDAVIHFAAESHVDRSINQAEPFITTNVMGTYRLADAVLQGKAGRLIHISTDEVYGDLAPDDPALQRRRRFLRTIRIPPARQAQTCLSCLM